MNKSNHPIDHLFREALAEQSIAPSEGARKAFVEEAMTIPVAGKNKRKRLLWLGGTGIIMLLSLVSWIYFAQEPSSVVKISQGTVPPSEPVIGTIKTTPDPSPGQPPLSETTDYPAAIQSKVNQSITNKKTNQAAIKTEIKAPLHDNEQPIPAPLTVNTPASVASPDNTPVIADAGLKISNNTIPETSTVVPDTENISRRIQDTVVSAQSSTDTIPLQPVVQPGSQSVTKGRKAGLPLSVGLSYSPEWMFNTLEGSKFINNFALEGIFHYGPFSIRTGAGISVGKGTNEVTISYNDYLGTYNHLDSMNFIWNNPSHNFVPTKYMSKKDVWDSLIKLDQARIVKRYTYIQVPLIFGYEVIRKESFSIGGRLGPVMSVLLNSKQLSAAYDPGKNKVLSINDISPGQINLNWQMMAGVAASIRLNDRFRIEIEPEVRYYFNSVYEKPYDNPKPWSAGIRAGLILDLK